MTCMVYAALTRGLLEVVADHVEVPRLRHLDQRVVGGVRMEQVHVARAAHHDTSRSQVIAQDIQPLSCADVTSVSVVLT